MSEKAQGGKVYNDTLLCVQVEGGVGVQGTLPPQQRVDCFIVMQSTHANCALAQGPMYSCEFLCCVHTNNAKGSHDASILRALVALDMVELIDKVMPPTTGQKELYVQR